MNPKGTGLGLNLCKNILEQLEGKIWLESSKEKKSGGIDHGSTFCFKVKVHE